MFYVDKKGTVILDETSGEYVAVKPGNFVKLKNINYLSLACNLAVYEEFTDIWKKEKQTIKTNKETFDFLRDNKILCDINEFDLPIKRKFELGDLVKSNIDTSSILGIIIGFKYDFDFNTWLYQVHLVDTVRNYHTDSLSIGLGHLFTDVNEKDLMKVSKITDKIEVDENITFKVTYEILDDKKVKEV